MTAVSLYIPLLAQSMADAEITEWMVADGDKVAEGQEILCLGTDKVEHVVQSPATGTIKLIAAQGETYDVGTEIAQIIVDLRQPTIADLLLTGPFPVASACGKGEFSESGRHDPHQR